MESASDAAPVILAQNDLISPGRSPATVSLLPPGLIELLDLLDCPWVSIPLPATVVYATSRISLAALNVRRVGDLQAIPGLTLLALADAARPLEPPLDRLWPDALSVASAVIGPALLAALSTPLTQVLARPAHVSQMASSDASPDAPYSALLFEPTVVLDAFNQGTSVSAAFDLWTPWGVYWRGSLDHLMPQHAPLLTPAAGRALAAAGFNAHITLNSLPWRSVRTRRTCERAGLWTVDELLACAPARILRWRNFGAVSFQDIIASLRDYLIPWLIHLPYEALLGDDAATVFHPYHDSPSLDPSTHGLLENTAENRHPTTADEQPPNNPFVALMDSDLGAALDLFGLPWRDIPLGELAPASARQALSARGPDSNSRLAAPALPADVSTSGLLGYVASLLRAQPVVLGLFDQTLGELYDAPELKVATWAQYPEFMDEVARETGATLSQRLAERATRPAAFQQGCGESLESLREVTIAGLLSDLFLRPYGGAALKSNAVQLIVWRHGLNDGQTRTLESAGQRMGVTRERVRQIEKKALDDLVEHHHAPYTRVLGTLTRLTVQSCEGVATLARAAAVLGAALPFGDVHPEATLRFIARWSDELTVTSDSLLIAAPYTTELVRRAQQALREAALAHHELGRDELITAAISAGGAALAVAGAPFVAAVLDTMSTLTAQDDHYQPVGRGSLKSRIVLAMRSLGRPSLVTDIAAEYRRLNPSESDRVDNSVRSFMLRFPDTFVLVGNSTYALAEWGYDPNVRSVASLVEQILAQSDKPLHQDDIVERAVGRYSWQAQSIVAQLWTNARIIPFGGGYFGLRDRDYGAFNPTSVSRDQIDTEPDARERLVVGAYTNQAGHRVVRLRLTSNCLSGFIPLTSRPVREMFPEPGKFRAQTWIADGPGMELILTRANHAMSGFRPLFTAVGAHTGDALFVERLTPAASDGAVAFRVAWASPGDALDAMRIVGLSATEHGPEVGDMAVLHYARKPYEIARLIQHASEHPWMPMTMLNTALGCLPHNPAASEYLRLGQVTGTMAVRGNTAQPGAVLRPTALGRHWGFAPEILPIRGRQLALSLPAYRAHVRSLAESHDVVSEQGEMQRLGESVIAAWDQRCAVSPGAPARAALEQSAAFVATNLLAGPSLPLLFLLLLAQTQGQGLARAAVDVALGGQGDAALGRLRALGLAVVADGAGRLAMAERVDVGIVSPDAVERALAGVADKTNGLPLSQAWRAAMRAADSSRASRASDLYSAVAAFDPDALYDLFVAPPAETPEAARFVDADLPYCGFPALVADWADAEGAPAGAGHAARETIVSYTCRGEHSLAPVGVALCDDLLAQPWDVGRRLAGNAHLLLLTIIAADEGGLAESLRRTDDGWRLKGAPLVSALDGLLRGLDYDVWDEPYRNDAERRAHLASELVAQGERLGLVLVDDGRMEAVSGLATRVYYEACDRGFMERVSVVANGASTLAG